MKVESLWERIKNGMDDGFDAAVTAVHNLTEKAGESIELTRLRRQKAHIEAQLTRMLAELGHTVYQNISKKGESDEMASTLGISELVASVREKDAAIIDIDQQLKQMKSEAD